VFSAPLAGGSISIESTPELLGVGYIIRTENRVDHDAGGVLSYLVIAPMIVFFGQGGGGIAPGTKAVGTMSGRTSRRAHSLYWGRLWPLPAASSAWSSPCQ
jgi:hypothetical protein